ASLAPLRNRLHGPGPLRPRHARPSRGGITRASPGRSHRLSRCRPRGYYADATTRTAERMRHAADAVPEAQDPPAVLRPGREPGWTSGPQRLRTPRPGARQAE